MSGGMAFTIIITYTTGVLGSSMLFSALDELQGKSNKLLSLVFAFLWPVTMPVLGVLVVMYAIQLILRSYGHHD